MSKINWTPKTGDGPFTAWTGTHLLVAHGRNAVLLKQDTNGVWNTVARAAGPDGRKAAEQALNKLEAPPAPIPVKKKTQIETPAADV